MFNRLGGVHLGGYWNRSTCVGSSTRKKTPTSPEVCDRYVGKLNALLGPFHLNQNQQILLSAMWCLRYIAWIAMCFLTWQTCFMWWLPSVKERLVAGKRQTKCTTKTRNRLSHIMVCTRCTLTFSTRFAASMQSGSWWQPRRRRCLETSNFPLVAQSDALQMLCQKLIFLMKQSPGSHTCNVNCGW